MKKNPSYELSQEYVAIYYFGMAGIIVGCLYFFKISLISIALVGYLILYFSKQTRKIEVGNDTVIFYKFIGRKELPISDILSTEEGLTQFHIKHKNGKISLDNNFSNLSGLKSTLSIQKPDIKEAEDSILAQATSNPGLFAISTIIKVVLFALLIAGIYFKFLVTYLNA